MNFTPFSDESPFFSPSALGFTPAGVSSAGPKTLDDIMSSSIFPTPTKATESARIDLNSEMNDRAIKNSVSATSDDNKIKFECNDSPDWTAVSTRLVLWTLYLSFDSFIFTF